MSSVQKMAAAGQAEVLQAVLDKLAGLPAQLRQTLTDHQWSQIPLYIDEWAFAAAQPQNVQLPVQRQTDGPEEITSVVASIPAGATGLIQLGQMTIPVGAGVTVVTPVQKVLQTTDTRGVMFTGPATGPAFLWLTGQQLPTFGVMAR